ncbi:hypothetical protein D0T49_01200 [Paludibacter sp. 221]|uniref:hypothetical protein n=1 Tax=Paludibacter sp. 221 TaxID=2302939 RepID=UPI0013D0A2BC|nr:hypothetical protein [Paludibacter sp. 221]NDV45667.1 hypothetical protein [Paludibacter sp. 221]
MRSKMIMIIFFNLNIFGQNFSTKNLEGYWIQLQTNEGNRINSNDLLQKEEDETIYLYYSKKTVTMIWFYESTQEIDTYTAYYGFFNSCNLPDIRSLRDNGNYYFMVDSLDFEDEEHREVNMQNACAELNSLIIEGDTLINIYYSHNQQYVIYKKVNSLPEKIKGDRKFLFEENYIIPRL